MITIYPNETYDGPKQRLFLAGGIREAREWHDELLEKIKHLNIVVFNPRRERAFEDYDHLTQVTWEYTHIRKSDLVSFFFPKEAPCIISLFELGSALGAGREMIIGVEPDYMKKRSIHTQLGLAGFKKPIAESLDALAEQIIKHFEG